MIGHRKEKEGALLAYNANTGTIHAVKVNSYDGDEKDFDTLCGRISEGVVTRSKPELISCKICKKRFKEGFHKSNLMELVEKVKSESEEEEEEWNLPPWFGELPTDDIDKLVSWLFYMLETLEETMDDKYYAERGWYPPGIEYNRGMKSAILTILGMTAGREKVEEFYREYYDET